MNSQEVYPKGPVDELFKLAGAALEEAANAYQQAQETIDGLQKQLEEVKAASGEKVTLEKVAGISQDQARQFAQLLADVDIIPEADMEKYASAIQDSPGSALAIAMEAVKISTSPVTQGTGIKSAAVHTEDAQEAENARWMDAVSLG